MQSLEETLNIWIESLKGYTYHQLIQKPSATGWSLGQVYMHILEATDFYLDQARICTSNNDNESETCSANAVAMFTQDSFPNEIIEGPPENALTAQPLNITQLEAGLAVLKNNIADVARKIKATHFRGKTKHPGLLYFSASQWMQFAEMHCRHHLRQKNKIDIYLKSVPQP
jgi:hypothetical protein